MSVGHSERVRAPGTGRGAPVGVAEASWPSDDRSSGSMGGRMTIGELGARVGVNPRTIRFYEDRGLLPAPARRPSGYRDYGEEDVTRLSFIRTAQRLGFNLSEVSEILAFKERGERPCDYVLQVLDVQVADVDRRLGELVALRAELVALKAKADRLPADDECYCRIVEHADPAVPPARQPRGVRP